MCGGGGGIGKVVSSIGSAIGGAVKGVVGAVKNVAKNPIFQAVAPMALNMFFPGLGAAAAGALKLSAAWAPAIGGALTGGIMGAIGGKGLGGALKGAAIGGIASGVGDYLMTGNNPLSGMFSGQEGGMANNALSAGGTGSTQLTGAGSGLGIDRSTVGTQFGALNPNPSPMPTNSLAGLDGTVGGLNPNAAGGAPGFSSKLPSMPSLSGLSNANQNKPAGGGMLSGIIDKAKGLMPTSTLGKVALGATGATLLGGMGGGGPRDQAPPPNPALTDPQFTRRLTPMNYNPNAGNTANINETNAHLFVNRNDPTARGSTLGSNSFGVSQPGRAMFEEIDPATGRPRPTSTTAAAGGMMPSYNMGGLAQYAEGGMSGNMAHGYLRGPGDGVSDDIPATIAGKQPARLAGGEFVVPARIVSELGNGSSEAGAKRLEQFMKRVNQLRLKTKDYAKDTRAYNLLPA